MVDDGTAFERPWQIKFDSFFASLPPELRNEQRRPGVIKHPEPRDYADGEPPAERHINKRRPAPACTGPSLVRYSAEVP